MYLVSALLLLNTIHIVSASCPDNLSNSCQCDDNTDTVKCTYGINETINIFNNSLDTSQIKLAKLDISNNNLSMLPNSFFDRVLELHDLDLSKNNFNDLYSIIPTRIATMIKKLDISHNKFDLITQSTFSSMPSLEVLNLSGNNLKTLPENVFVNNKYLGSLDMSHNDLMTLSSMNLNGLEKSLRHINLGWNKNLGLDKNTLSNLHDLKAITLAGNTKIVTLSNLDFPLHLTLLDLGFCGIQSTEECIFWDLTDLEYLSLQGNPLKCSCHLTWLYQHIVYNQELDQIIPYQERQYNNWTCVDSTGNIINVNSFQTDCSDHFFLDKPDHCIKSENNAGGFDSVKWKESINLNVEKEDNGVLLQWHGYNSSDFMIYGFQITIHHENGDKIYTSEILHKTARKYVATPQEMENGKFQVCLNVLHNDTEIIGSACKELSYIDLQIIVGILAGVIFLIPCVVALIYIMCLDKKKFSIYNEYSELTRDKSENKSEKKSSKTTDKKESAKWTNTQQKKTDIPKITLQDYTLTNTQSTDNIIPNDHDSLPVVHSTDRILHSDENSSIEPDGDSGSSAGIRIDIPSDNESGLTNEGYAHDNSNVIDVKL